MSENISLLMALNLHRNGSRKESALCFIQTTYLTFSWSIFKNSFEDFQREYPVNTSSILALPTPLIRVSACSNR